MLFALASTIFGLNFDRECVKSGWKLYTDGQRTRISVYNIGGNNILVKEMRK